MTNHWRDIKHADLILINGANPAEAHPVGFQWFVKAKLDPTKGPGAGGGGEATEGPTTSQTGFAKRDMTLQDPDTVWQRMAKHYSRYTPEMVSSITGIPVDQYMQVAKLVGEMGKPDKVMTIVYAVGLTHHTTGGQLIRSGALLQLILGNMGRPGGGMNAERGHANIQGNTDHAISWEILPGYLRIPAPGQKNLDDY